MEYKIFHAHYFVVYFFLLASQFFGCTENSPLVVVSEGQLQGAEFVSRGGVTYYGFLGVPYGTVPVRFELAQPYTQWSGIRDATQFGAVCPQLQTGSTTVIGKEECLFLNIYTRNLTGNMPVIVYFHGGAFMTGSANFYGGSFFLDEDIVLITVNYRLGALGFLSTGDEVVQGNAGLKDQSLALRWVKTNVHHFGGTPNRITLMGDSSGASSVAFHLLSHMSKDLFHQAIIQSGSSLDPKHFDYDPLPQAVDLAETLDCPTFPTTDLADCLRKTNFRKIVQIKLTKWHLDPLVQYPPTKETLRSGQTETDVFLPDFPLILLQNGRFCRVPTVIGITEEEGLLFHSASILRNVELQRNMNEDWNYVAPITLYYDKQYIPVETRHQISRTIRGFYFGDRKVGPSASRNLTNLYSDRLFNWGVRTTAMHLAKFTPVYLYIFGFLGDFSSLQLLNGDLFREPLGVTHGDDIQYFFNSTEYPPLKTNSHSEQMSQAVVRLWASFAKTGTMMNSLQTLKIAWLPVGPEEIRRKRLKWCYIGTESKILMKEPFFERMEFWDKISDQQFNIFKNSAQFTKNKESNASFYKEEL